MALADAFRDGVYFVNLAPIRDRSCGSTIAPELGMADAGERPRRTAKRHFHAREILLVLTTSSRWPTPRRWSLSCSRLHRTEGAATSREALRIHGEEFRRSPGAARWQQLSDLARLTQYEAVRLFIERAQAIKPDFVVTNETAPAVAEICHRLDGLPLATKLAAARIRLFGPQTLLIRLSHPLAVLTTGPRDLPSRQQTLRNTIEWSYALLSTADQTLFARLGVFAGGFTLEAAEVVCGDRPLSEVIGASVGEDAAMRELRCGRSHRPQLALATEEICGAAGVAHQQAPGQNGTRRSCRAFHHARDHPGVRAGAVARERRGADHALAARGVLCLAVRLDRCPEPPTRDCSDRKRAR